MTFYELLVAAGGVMVSLVTTGFLFRIGWNSAGRFLENIDAKERINTFNLNATGGSITLSCEHDQIKKVLEYK
jgi:hypothetical protein